MNKILALSASILGLTALAGSAQAQVIIGVQFPQTYSGLVSPLNGGGGNGYTAGVVPQVYWNVANPFTNSGPGTGNVSPITNANLVNSSNAPVSTVLMTSTGGTSTLQFSVTNATDNDHGSASGGFPSPIWYTPGGLADAYLAQGTDFSNSVLTPVTLTLSNLNAGDSYNLIAYVGSAWYYGADSLSVNLGSTTYYLTTDSANSLTTWTPSTSMNPLVSPTADYVEFTGIMGSALNSESLTVTGAGTGLSGFQLIDNGPAVVPEPSTWAMMLGGLCMLGFCVRRKAALIK